ncbi:MAG TPA: UBP-type zinc finger domain-containing protein [Casimicrobiaceae bacterium]
MSAAHRAWQAWPSCPEMSPALLSTLGAVQRNGRFAKHWVHLRTCQTCGGARCCDSSSNRHASKHAGSSGHPVIAAAEEGERWLYCYADDAFAEY